jgi:hypothetical protein
LYQGFVRKPVPGCELPELLRHKIYYIKLAVPGVQQTRYQGFQHYVT